MNWNKPIFAAIIITMLAFVTVAQTSVKHELAKTEFDVSASVLCRNSVTDCAAIKGVILGGTYFFNKEIAKGVKVGFRTEAGINKNKAADTYLSTFGVLVKGNLDGVFQPFATLQAGMSNEAPRAIRCREGICPNDIGVAVIAGGGVDYRLKGRTKLRLRADYIQSRIFKGGDIPSHGNVRVSIGVVL